MVNSLTLILFAPIEFVSMWPPLMTVVPEADSRSSTRSPTASDAAPLASYAASALALIALNVVAPSTSTCEALILTLSAD